MTTEVLQATGFSLSGGWKWVHKNSRRQRGWPMFEAIVFNADDSVLDMRHSWNDCELARWLASFGFDLTDYDWQSTQDD